MPRERIKDQVERMIGNDLQMSQVHEEFSCKKHQWLGHHFGPCPTCRREAEEAKHVKKLRAWERYRDLVSLTERLLPKFVRGCHTEEELMNGTCAAVRVARNALAMLDADLPKESEP